MAQPELAFISPPPGPRQATPEPAKKVEADLASGPKETQKLAENIDQEIDFNIIFEALLSSNNTSARLTSPPLSRSETAPKPSNIALAGPHSLPSINLHQIEGPRPEKSHIDMSLAKQSHPQSTAPLAHPLPVTATTPPEVTGPDDVSRRAIAQTPPHQSQPVAHADSIDKIQHPAQKKHGDALLSKQLAAATKTGKGTSKSARSNILPDDPIGIASINPPSKPFALKTIQDQLLPTAKMSLPKAGQKSPEVIGEKNPTPEAMRQTDQQIDRDLTTNSVAKIKTLDSFFDPHPSAEAGSIKLALQSSPQSTTAALPFGLPSSGGQTITFNTAVPPVFITPPPSSLALISIINPTPAQLQNGSFSIGKNTGGIDLVIHSTELGQIDIELKLDETRAIRAIISTDLNRNLDFLRSHSAMLEYNLKESGFDNVDISFQSQENKHRANHPDAEQENLTLENPDDVALPHAITTALMSNDQPGWWTSDHLDMKL